MEPRLIYSLLGCIASAITLVITVRMIRGKTSARKNLLEQLSGDVQFLEELHRFQELKSADEEKVRTETARLNTLIKENLSKLDGADRSRIEASLYQPSTIGRKRFIRKLVDDAAELQHS